MSGRCRKFSGQYWNWLCRVGWGWGGVGWLPSGKAPHGFYVAEGAFMEGANVAGAAPMLFLFSALRTFGICVRASQRSSSIAFPPPSPTSSSSHPSPKFWTCRAATHLHQNEELQGQNASAIFLWQEGPFPPWICRERFAWEVLNWWSSPQGWIQGRLAACRWRGNVCGWGCRWFCVDPITQPFLQLHLTALLQSGAHLHFFPEDEKSLWVCQTEV